MSHRKSKVQETAEEFLAKLRRDPDFVEMESKREREMQENSKEYQRHVQPVTSELKAAGYEVSVVRELRYNFTEYRSAIPILCKWVTRVTNEAVKEDIVRTLSVPWAKPDAAGILIAEFKRADNSPSMKWVIGNALSIVADETYLDALMELAKDRSYGSARQMIVRALGNFFQARARTEPVLIEQLSDSDVAIQAVVALGKLRSVTARPFIEKIASASKGGMRREAKAALGRIDKS